MLRKVLIVSYCFFSFVSLAASSDLSGIFLKKNASFYLDTAGGDCKKLNTPAELASNNKCVMLNLSRMEKINGAGLTVDKFQQSLASMEGKTLKIKGEISVNATGTNFLVKEINF